MVDARRWLWMLLLLVGMPALAADPAVPRWDREVRAGHAVAKASGIIMATGGSLVVLALPLAEASTLQPPGVSLMSRLAEIRQRQASQLLRQAGQLPHVASSA